MTSKGRNIWDSLRNSDPTTTTTNVSSHHHPCNDNSVADAKRTSVALHLPYSYVEMPFAGGTGYEERGLASTNFSRHKFQKRWNKKEQDRGFLKSCPKNPFSDRDGPSRDSRKYRSPIFEIECLQRKSGSMLENSSFPLLALSANLSENKSTNKCCKSSCVHQHRSVVEQCLSGKVPPVYHFPVFSLELTPPSVNYMNVMQKCYKGSSGTVASVNSVHPEANHSTAGAVANGQHSLWIRHDKRNSLDYRNSILSCIEFGDCLRLNGNSFVSAQNCGSDSTLGQNDSVKCDVTSATGAVSDLISDVSHDSCSSKPIVELNESKCDDSYGICFKKENMINDAVVPVLVPENSSSSIDVGCHPFDHDIEMGTLSEMEGMPSFKCPFDIDEHMKVGESRSRGGFSGVEVSGNMHASSSLTAKVSTVGVKCSASFKITSSDTCSFSTSANISSFSEISKRYSTRTSEESSQWFSGPNAYTELQQLYQSKQLLGDSLFANRSFKTDQNVGKLGAKVVLSGTGKNHWRPFDDVCDTVSAAVQHMNDDTDSEIDNGDVQGAIEEVLKFSAINLCSPTLPISETGETLSPRNNSNAQGEFKNLLNYSEILNRYEIDASRGAAIDCLISNISLPEFSEGPTASNMTSLNVCCPMSSATTSASDEANETSVGLCDLVRHVSDSTFVSDSCIDPPLENSVILDGVFQNEQSKNSHNLDFYSESHPVEIFDKPTKDLTSLSFPSHNSQFISEYSSSVEDGRISENSVSPCSVYQTDECFLDTWNLSEEMQLCVSVHKEDVSKSSSNSNKSVGTYLNESDSNTNLSMFNGLATSSTSRSVETASNLDLTGDGAQLQIDSGNKMIPHDLYSESSRSELNNNPSYMKIEKCSNKSRRPRLLTEIESSDGFVAEKKPNRSSDSLFIDSKLLSREERALQMIHMQITKMEVKEELTRLKKSRKSTETLDQSTKSKNANTKGTSEGPASNKKINSILKISSPSSCVIDEKRLKKRNLWSSRNFKQQRNLSSYNQRTESRQISNDRNKITKVQRKLKIRSKLRKMKYQEFNLRIKSRFDIRQKVNKKEQQMKGSTEPEALQVCVDGTELSVVSSAVSPNVSSKECSKKLNEIDESSYHLVPFVPLEVKRIVGCHSTGETILHKAARLGYEDVALWCCQSGFIDVNVSDNAGYTPLHESCLSSQLRITEYLIHYGANVNAVSGVDGRRPLHEAVESGCLETVRLLLSAGADVTLTTYSGNSVLELSKSQRMKEFLKAYLSELNGVSDTVGETEWQFPPFWDDGTISSGSDLLCDVPMYDPKCDEFYIELAEK